MPQLKYLIHILTHALFAVLCLLVVKFGQEINPLLLLPAIFGAFLPDIDTTTSFIGRAFLPLSRVLETRFGHRQEVHTVWAVLILYALTWPLTRLAPELKPFQEALVIGYVSHLLLDLLNPKGIAPFLPFSSTRLKLLGGRIEQTQASERALFLILIIAVAATAILSNFGTAQLLHAVLPVPDLARENYRQWEGHYRVYADVDGTWQDASHRRIQGRFEVTSLSGEVFTLRDPQTGGVFTAGQAAHAEVYLTSIHVVKGEAIETSQLPTPTPTPTPTPHTLTIRIAHVTDPETQIKVQPGDPVEKGQLLADLTIHATPQPTIILSLPKDHPPAPSPTWSPDPLDLIQADADLSLARAEYARAIAPPTPHPDTLARAQAELELAQAALAEAQAELNAWYTSPHPPATWMIASREKERDAYAELVAHWTARLAELNNLAPDPLDVAVAQARLRLAEIAYQRALATPTPKPTIPPTHTPTPTPTPPAEEYRAIVPGQVLAVRIVSISGNEATVDIVLIVEDTIAGFVPTNQFTNTQSPNRKPATVVEVIDGDIIDVILGDTRERVRFIGVDTPETKHPTQGTQCYGPEASAYTTELLPAGTAITLVFDVEQRDKYERLLAYVYLSDDQMLNALLLQDGYARTLTIPPNTAHAAEFAQLESQAQNAALGLWSACNP